MNLVHLHARLVLVDVPERAFPLAAGQGIEAAVLEALQTLVAQCGLDGVELPQRFLERQVAVLSSDRLGAALGHGLTALVEVSLDQQGSEHLEAFEARAVAHDAVQQCWRVSPGPDFMLVVQAADMPHYLSISQALFTQDANVRNVKAFFATKRAKFTTTWPVLR